MYGGDLLVQVLSDRFSCRDLKTGADAKFLSHNIPVIFSVV